MQIIGIVSVREPEVIVVEGSPTVRLVFRGLRDSRTTADRDTRVTVTLPSAQARQLWQQLGHHLAE